MQAKAQAPSLTTAFASGIFAICVLLAINETLTAPPVFINIFAAGAAGFIGGYLSRKSI
jgi:hypothetical protein